MFGLLVLIIGCSGGAEEVYATCAQAEDCTAPEAAEAACLEKGDDGYCSWRCGMDEDCADDTGGASELVCASFESEEAMYCFPICEDDDVGCPDGMTCRSTGGGSSNRKICFPDEG